MKKKYIVVRWIIGLLFIFSGLIKANDPLGLSYKMQEFFEVWGLTGLDGVTLPLSIVMNIFEVAAGVAVILGWRMKIFSWLLLILIIFFSFLTGYAHLSGKIKTCGCFGDCIPLTSLTSFIKDLFLLLLILILFFNRNKILSDLHTPFPQVIILLSIAGTFILQWYALSYLPLMDCLPYKKGDNLIKNMQLPPGALPDSFLLTFKYQKDGKIIEFSNNDFPEDFDDSYTFIERGQKLVRKGTALPKITDFSLHDADGTDVTNQVLETNGRYILLFALDFSTFDKWHTEKFEKVLALTKEKNIPFYFITASKQEAVQRFGNTDGIQILTCDGVAIKTAARVNPTYFIMDGPVVQEKLSYKQAGEVGEFLKR